MTETARSETGIQSGGEDSTGKMAEDRGGVEMLLWAADGAAPPDHPNVVLWHGGTTRAGVRSIAAHIDADTNDIRRRYLAWAHDLGEISVGGRRLRERFLLADGASLWAQSAFVEQSPWIQRSVETILKVLAFEGMIERETPAQVTAVGTDKDLDVVLRSICRNRGIRYACSKKRTASPPAAAVRTTRFVPRFLRGFIWLAHLAVTRLTARSVTLPAGDTSVAARRVLICGPFSNHNGAEHVDAGGEFVSRFWGHLPRLLADNGFQVHWLHYFFAHEATPDMRTANRLIARMNTGSSSGGVHALVDSYLTLAGVARILARWLAISAESIRVGWVLRKRFAQAPQQSYWPLIRDDWANALRGAACVENLFFAECFDRALMLLPRYPDGLYLMENQSWERALARAWRKHGHGRLAAVAHSTIRYWDLRYHCDPRRYDDAEYRRFLPAPDVVVLNGPAARGEYLSSATQRETLADCEALRYLHLVPGTSPALPRADDKGTLRILVLGDFQRQATDALVHLAQATQQMSRVPIDIRVKPHPICPVGPLDYAGMSLTIVNDIVARLVPDAHAVLASNTTSSAVEAYVSGGRVFVYDPGAGVNYSPLRRVDGVSFVRTATDLVSALDRLRSSHRQDGTPEQRFFNIDTRLPGWRRYFGIADPAREECV